jgi:hypothetical protein
MSMPPGRKEFRETLHGTEILLIQCITMSYIPIKGLEITELIKNVTVL